MWPRKHARCRGAFTLVEVLLVVVVIALLMAILVPSLSQAREQSLNERPLIRGR